MARRRPSAASFTAARFNPGRLIRKEDQSAVRHDRLRLATRELRRRTRCDTRRLRRSRPDERESGTSTLVIKTRRLRHLAVLGASPRPRIDVSIICKHSG